MRLFVICLTAVLLAGCYESRDLLLDTTAWRQPVKAAMDWKYSAEGKTYHARLKPRADGWYDFDEAPVDEDGSEGDWEHHTAILNFLQADRGADIYILGTWNEEEDMYMYGLAVVRKDFNWRIVMPNCDMFTARGEWYRADLASARRASATRIGGRYGCYFTSANALKAAMRYVVRSEGFWTRVAATQS